MIGFCSSVPSALHPRWPDRKGAALNLLRRVECRMLVIDELHNLLAASIPRQHELLNFLRYLGNELRIPLACLGTREAYLAIRTDDQLENRFEPFLLPSWEDGAEFGRLLAISRRCCRCVSRPALGCQRCAR